MIDGEARDNNNNGAANEETSRLPDQGPNAHRKRRTTLLALPLIALAVIAVAAIIITRPTDKAAGVPPASTQITTPTSGGGDGRSVALISSPTSVATVATPTAQEEKPTAAPSATSVGKRTLGKATAVAEKGNTPTIEITPTPSSTPTPTVTPTPAVPLDIKGLHVRGNRIVNSSNRIVRLHGVNRSGTEYACIQGWGFFDGPADAKSIQAMAAWNVNAVRVPMNEDCWLGINGAPEKYSGAVYQQAIADYVSLLNQHGMVVILELHWSAPGNEKATGQNPMPDRDHSVTFWKQVATRFKDNSSVIFDLFNEPYPDNNQDTTAAWECWKNGGSCPGLGYQAAGMQELVSTVRDTGAKNIIMLGGVQYSNAFSRWLEYKPKDPAHNLAASWHVYNFNICNTTSCWNATAAPIADAVPLITGEIGEDDCGSSFILSLMGWLDRHEQSYLGWVWDTWPSCSALISDYEGTPKDANGRAFKSHLATLDSGPGPLYVPAPPKTPDENQSLVVYGNSIENSFSDGSFSFRSRNECDRSTYVSAPCSYAVEYNAWGAVSFRASRPIDVHKYTRLEWDFNPNGVPIKDFSMLLTNSENGNVVKWVTLSSDNIVKRLSNGWVHMALPISKLNPSKVHIGGVQLKNATWQSLPMIHIDNVQFVFGSTLDPTASPTNAPASKAKRYDAS